MIDIKTVAAAVAAQITFSNSTLGVNTGGSLFLDSVSGALLSEDQVKDFLPEQVDDAATKTFMERSILATVEKELRLWVAGQKLMKKSPPVHEELPLFPYKASKIKYTASSGFSRGFRIRVKNLRDTNLIIREIGLFGWNTNPRLYLYRQHETSPIGSYFIDTEIVGGGYRSGFQFFKILNDTGTEEKPIDFSEFRKDGYSGDFLLLIGDAGLSNNGQLPVMEYPGGLNDPKEPLSTFAGVRADINGWVDDRLNYRIFSDTRKAAFYSPVRTNIEAGDDYMTDGSADTYDEYAAFIPKVEATVEITPRLLERQEELANWMLYAVARDLLEMGIHSERLNRTKSNVAKQAIVALYGQTGSVNIRGIVEEYKELKEAFTLDLDGLSFPALVHRKTGFFHGAV